MNKEHPFYGALVAIADCIEYNWKSGLDPNDDDVTAIMEELNRARDCVKAAAVLYDLATAETEDMDATEKCSRCNDRDGSEKLHPCPYQADIYENPKPYCKCCQHCINVCREEI